MRMLDISVLLSKAGQEKRRKVISPSASKRGQEAPKLKAGDADLSCILVGREAEEVGGGFSLKRV